MAWDLQEIIQKVRNVTGTPSGDQLTDAQITTYINNYYTLTMPFELKEQIQLNFYDFKVFPGINTYPFSGSFLTDQPGAYADGFPLIFYQDPDIFYQDFPQQYSIDSLATGDGSTSNFVGGLQNPPIIIGTTFFTDGFQVLSDSSTNQATQTLATGNGTTVAFTSPPLMLFPIEPNTVQITSGVETFKDNGSGILTSDKGGTGTVNYLTGAWSLTFITAPVVSAAVVATYAVMTTLGVLTGNGIGTINYFTGAYNITFANPPASTLSIYAKYQGYQPNRPQGVLFFQNQFTFMPVPDQVYQIRMQGYIAPDLLNIPSDMPMLPEWGQLLSYGAALDIFSDRGDMDNYSRYWELLKRFENVALARTIQQYQAEQSVERF